MGADPAPLAGRGNTAPKIHLFLVSGTGSGGRTTRHGYIIVKPGVFRADTIYWRFALKVEVSMPTITIEWKLPVEVKKEHDWIVARTPALDVYSQGRTQEEAMRNLVEAIQLFIESCIERGTLDSVLKACGFHASHQKEASKPSSNDDQFVTVPISLVANNAAPAHAH